MIRVGATRDAGEARRRRRLEATPFETDALADLAPTLKRVTLDQYEAIDDDLRRRLLDAHIHKRGAAAGGPRRRLRSNVHFVRFLHGDAAAAPVEADFRRSMSRSVMLQAGLLSGDVGPDAVLDEIDALEPGDFLWLTLASGRHGYDLRFDREASGGLKMVAAEKYFASPDRVPVTRLEGGPLAGDPRGIVRMLVASVRWPDAPGSIPPTNLLQLIGTTTYEPGGWSKHQVGPTCWIAGRSAALAGILPRSTRSTLKQSYIRALGEELGGERDRDIDAYCRERARRRVERATDSVELRATLLEADASGRTTLMSALLGGRGARSAAFHVARGVLADEPLFAAALDGDVRAIRAELSGLDPEGRAARLAETRGKGWTPLGYAIIGGHVDAVATLLDAGARLTVERSIGSATEAVLDPTYLEAALASGAGEALFAIFARHLAPTEKRELAAAQLLDAIPRGDVGRAWALLAEEGPQILHALGPDRRRTPMGCALTEGLAQVDAWLTPEVFAGLEPEHLLGQHVLHVLMKRADPETVHRLLERLPPSVTSALLAERDASALTPLGRTCQAASSEHVRALWRRDPALFEVPQSSLRLTPWMLLAAQAQHIEVLVELLAEARPDLGAGDALGSTALHYAVAKGNPAAVLALVANGAPVDARNARGESPLDMAQARGDAASLGWLRSPQAAILRVVEDALPWGAPLGAIVRGAPVELSTALVERLLDSRADEHWRLCLELSGAEAPDDPTLRRSEDRLRILERHGGPLTRLEIPAADLTPDLATAMIRACPNLERLVISGPLPFDRLVLPDSASRLTRLEVERGSEHLEVTFEGGQRGEDRLRRLIIRGQLPRPSLGAVAGALLGLGWLVGSALLRSSGIIGARVDPPERRRAGPADGSARRG